MADIDQAQAPEREGVLKRIFTQMMPLEQRQLLGTLVFFAIILVVGWVGINEPARMQTFTAQYNGRSVERGAVIFASNCSSCHGLDGRGLPGVGPALNAPDLFNGERLASIGWTGTLRDYIYLTVAAGRPKMSGDWPQPMPTWSQEYGGPMRPDQIRDVTNYILNYSRLYEEGYEGPAVSEAALPTATPGAPSFEPVGPDPAVELPEGDPTRGEALFAGAEPGPDGAVLGCNACHSLDGSVLVGPSVQGIASRPLPEGYDSLDSYLHTSITQPGAYIVESFTDVMPKNFGERLDAQSLADLIAYLKALE